MLVWFRESIEQEEEFDALKKSGIKYTNRLLEIPHNSLVVGRYSVLPFYRDLEQELKIISSRFVNSYDEHRYIADIENWYGDLKDYTPKTYFEWFDLPENSYVMKGRTNSRKFEWNRKMFCATKSDISRISNSLLDDSLVAEQGICVREYVPLKQFDVGINGLPITNEWRIFCYKGQTIIGDYYWSNYENCKPYEFSDLPKKALDLLEVVKKIISENTNFYVIDIAETKSGEWIVIEINDGQMSGISMIDPVKFYCRLNEVMGQI